MKPFEIPATVFLTVVLTFTGCSKPEEPDYFRYTVNDYPLQQGFIHNYGILKGATGFNFDVTIYSPGISYNRENHEFQGTGHVIFFQMFSSSATELASGTYQFSAGKTSGLPWTFNEANFGMNLNFSEETGTVVSAVSGTVKVSGTGEYRAFDFNCTTATGEKVTGHYNGYIPVYDLRNTLKPDWDIRQNARK
jgi:hypothetical protein